MTDDDQELWDWYVAHPELKVNHQDVRRIGLVPSRDLILTKQQAVDALKARMAWHARQAEAFRRGQVPERKKAYGEDELRGALGAVRTGD